MTNLEPGVTIYSEYYSNPKAKVPGTFIFFNGSGSDISVWKNKKLFDCVKNIGSVFFYDRNGIGKSPPDFKVSGKNPITAKLISDRLSLLLKKLQIKPPYLLVAHSHGAMYAGYFALKNPHLVKGMLLVDPMPYNCSFSNSILDNLDNGLKEIHTKSAKYIYKKYDASMVESFYQIAGLNVTKQIISQLGSINKSIPVLILSSKVMELKKPCEKDWYKGQKLWLNQNPRSEITKVQSDHFIQLIKPELVCSKLRQILSD